MSTAAQIEAVQRLVRESVAAVDAIAPSAVRAVLPALRQAREELRRDLRAWLETAPDGADRFTAFQKQQVLRALDSAMDRVAELEPAMSHALGRTRSLTGPLAVANLETEIQRLSAIFGGGIPTIPQINTAAILAKGDRILWKRHEHSAARYAGAIGDDIRQLFAVGVAKGETFEQLVNRLRKLGDPGARTQPIDPGADADVIAGGLFRRHKWWADRLVRTEMMNAYNVQHDEAISYANEHRPEGDEEFLRRWDAAADPRTCVLCMELDGTVTTIDGTFKGGIANPPRHPCCRCVVLAWLARWDTSRTRTELATTRDRRQREDEQASGGMRIGEFEIAGCARHGAAEEPTEPDAERPARHPRVSEAAARDAVLRAESELARKAAELAQQQAEVAAAAIPRGTTSTWRPGDEQRTRQVVHLAARGPRTSEEWYQYDLEQARRRTEREERMRGYRQPQTANERDRSLELRRQEQAAADRRRAERAAQDRQMGLPVPPQQVTELRTGWLAKLAAGFREDPQAYARREPPKASARQPAADKRRLFARLWPFGRSR